MSSETSHAKGPASHRGLARPSGVASRLAPNNTPLAPANKQSRAPWTSRVRTPRHLFVFSTSNAGKTPPTVARRCAPIAPPGFALRSPPPIRASAREKGPRPACARARTHTHNTSRRSRVGIGHPEYQRDTNRRPAPGHGACAGPFDALAEAERWLRRPAFSLGSASAVRVRLLQRPTGRQRERKQARRAPDGARAAGGWEEF